MNIARSIICKSLIQLLTLSSASDDYESDLALDFSSFLLRYNRELDYQAFSDDLNIQNKIKRAETFRSWADIEDLAHGFENLSSNFETHRTTAANAFQELYQYVEKTKKEIGSKSGGGYLDSELSVLRRLELIEQKLGSIDSQEPGVQSYTVGGAINPKIIKDAVTN